MQQKNNHYFSLVSDHRLFSAVEIVNGQILSKSGGEAEEKWNAWTPTPYLVNVSETYSTVSLYSGPSYSELSSLAHAPLRPVRDCHTLSFVIANRQSVEGTHVSVMAAIRHVSDSWNRGLILDTVKNIQFSGYFT